MNKFLQNDNIFYPFLFMNLNDLKNEKLSKTKIIKKEQNFRGAIVCIVWRKASKTSKK